MKFVIMMNVNKLLYIFYNTILNMTIELFYTCISNDRSHAVHLTSATQPMHVQYFGCHLTIELLRML